jgi:hypothetical protein
VKDSPFRASGAGTSKTDVCHAPDLAQLLLADAHANEFGARGACAEKYSERLAKPANGPMMSTYDGGDEQSD